MLVVGGSLGAKCLNDTVPEVVKAIPQLTVRHQCGKGNTAQVTDRYTQLVGENLEWQVADFIDDMVEAYTWADIIICRAGALTVAEVAAAGRCAIFVPLPHAVDDHQTLNARSLVDNDAAILLPQSELESGQLVSMLGELANMPAKVCSLGNKARTQAKLDAAQEVAKQCTALTGVAA